MGDAQINPLLVSKGFKPRKGKVVECVHCKKEIYKRPSEIKRSNIYFCSKDCYLIEIKENSFNFSCAICGNKVFTQPSQIKYRSRNTCSIQCKNILRRKVANERRLRLGYTKHQLDRLARYSPEARDWRKAVFERDDYTCQMCGLRGTYLEADHIKPWAYFPDLRFEISNGRTLCRPCHDKTKVSAIKMRKIYLSPK